MPPKKKGGAEPGKKADQKQKAKVIEDKTFGLKNKKGGKQQKFIKMVTSQVQHGNKSSRQLEQEKDQKKSKKDQKKQELEELNALFKPVQQLSKGADPKSVLCAFFKQGQCGKGAKCKFSHDLNIQRKGEKRSIYGEDREGEDNMEDWDEAKLEEVVNKKHGESNKKKSNTTTIICRYFLDAVENSKYGWFWQCPNGDDCKYRHALPSGFILKKDKKKMDEKEEKISLEELIEKERAALGSSLTKVTLETFLQWKERKRKEKISKFNAENEKKKADFKAGRMVGLSGRDMFSFNPELVAGDDDEGADVIMYKQEEEDEAVDTAKVVEISLDGLAAMAKESDGSGTVAPPAGSRVNSNGAMVNGIETEDDESRKLGMAAALPPEAAEAAAADALAGDTPIDENLFDGEDLDMVEEELDTLDLED